MARKITIPPEFGHPCVVITINDSRHYVPTGVEIEVEDYVADFIERIIKSANDDVMDVDPLHNCGDMQPLTFTGAVNATYDGSEAVTVEIPQGGGGENWELIDDTTLTEAVESYVKTFDAPMKKLLVICKPGVAISKVWFYATLKASKNYPFPISQFAFTKTERLVISIEEDDLLGLRFIKWYVAESDPANGTANATKNGSGVFKCGTSYMPAEVEAFGFTTAAMLVEGANIVIKGVRK